MTPLGRNILLPCANCQEIEFTRSTGCFSNCAQIYNPCNYFNEDNPLPQSSLWALGKTSEYFLIFLKYKVFPKEGDGVNHKV